MDLGETVGKILIFCNVPQQVDRPDSDSVLAWDLGVPELGLRVLDVQIN